MAPYQHVHIGLAHKKHSEHDESTIVHSHPYAVSIPANSNDGTSAGHSHKAHASIALDTFTTLAHGVLFLFFQPQSSVQIFAPSESAVFVEITEPRGHDPPGVETTVPRAPPV